MTIADLHHRMSSAEFTGWIAYRQIVGPFGEQGRGDLRMGIAVSTYLNSQQSKHRFEPADFMPFRQTEADEEDQEPMTIEEQTVYLRKLNAMLGGREIRKVN